MKEIKLTKGYVAIVDDDDFDALSKYKWFASVKPNGKAYAVRSRLNYDGKRGVIQMHRIIMGDPDGLLVDHKNGNSLDNRKSNLRTCTNSENLMNRGRQRDNTSGYKGVCFFKARMKYRAEIKKNGKKKHLGLFICPVLAAKAYDEAAKVLHGEFAMLNFPAQ